MKTTLLIIVNINRSNFSVTVNEIIFNFYKQISAIPFIKIC